MKSLTDRIFLSPPWVGVEERQAVQRAFDSGYVAPCGPQVEEFERQFAELVGRRYAVAVASGTAALELAMAELGVDREWTVIAPTLTFIATVGPAWRRGAKLVFVDSAADGNVDVTLVEDALKQVRGEAAMTKARRGESKVLVIGVDLYGKLCDYAGLGRLCRRYGAKLLIDSAEAVGTKGAGKAGFAAVFSFNGNKIITTSGGGMLVTDDRKLAERARKRSQQSREPALWYEHREVGYNFRLSNLLAAVGLAQLKKLPKILKARAANHRFWAEIFPGRLLPAGNCWLSIAVLDTKRERDQLLKRLSAANIEARPVWKPMHLQPVFRGCRVYGGAVAEALFNRGICLPSGTELFYNQRYQERIRGVLQCK